MRTEGPAVEDAPIFVVGAMRSGTTLMRLVLDSHDHIGIAPETGVMRIVRANRFVPFWMFGDEWHDRLGIGERELDGELARFYGGLLRRHADAHGKRRWGEKTPWHVWHLEEMARLWPGAVFVATVRHPGGNVGSMVSRWKMPLRRAIGHWKNANRELVRRSADLGGRLLVVRYEDLLFDAEATLRDLLERLGEEWSPRVLEHEAVHRERGTARQVEGRTRSTDAIDPARATSWTHELGEDDLDVLRAETGAMAEFFGYSFADPAALDRIARSGRVLTGSELDERRTRFAHVPELQTAPTVPLAERRLDPDDVELRGKGRAGGRRQRPEAKGQDERPSGPARRIARRLRRLASGR